MNQELALSHLERLYYRVATITRSINEGKRSKQSARQELAILHGRIETVEYLLPADALFEAMEAKKNANERESRAFWDSIHALSA